MNGNGPTLSIAMRMKMNREAWLGTQHSAIVNDDKSSIMGGVNSGAFVVA
jgi:hypothetical protein